MSYIKITITDDDQDKTEWIFDIETGNLDLTKMTGQSFPFGPQPQRAELFIAIERLAFLLDRHPYKEFKLEYID